MGAKPCSPDGLVVAERPAGGPVGGPGNACGGPGNACVVLILGVRLWCDIAALSKCAMTGLMVSLLCSWCVDVSVAA